MKNYTNNNQKLTRKNIDIKTKINNVLKVLPSLTQLYDTRDNETKKTIMCSIFAQKIEFDETVFEPPKSILHYLLSC